MDCISVLASLIIFAIATFAGNITKSIISINLMVVLVVMFAMYSVVRWVVCIESEELRRDIVIWGVTAICVGGVFVGMRMMFGTMVLILVLVAIMLVLMGIL